LSDNQRNPLWARKRLIHLTWSEIAVAVDHIGRKIQLDNFSPDIIVGISRGGLAPTLLLSHNLGIRNLEIVKAKYYDSGVYPTILNPKPVIGHIPFEVAYQTGLLVDDIAGTGDTLSAVSLKLGDKIKNIKTATLVKNMNCRIEVDYFFALVDDFVVFPWEENQPIAKPSLPSVLGTEASFLG